MSSSHHSNLAFRCLACCTSLPSLFLTYHEVQDHFPQVHKTSLVTEAVLLPSSLESLQCLLCPSQPLLTEATFRTHLRTHSCFFDREEKWRGRCQRLCRICGEDVGGAIEEHLELQHPRYTFACEGDLEEDSMEKEFSVQPTEMRSPTCLTKCSSLMFSVKVEKPDSSYQQPCKTESCSSKKVKPSPVNVLHHLTAEASHSARPSLPEDNFQGQLLPLPCISLPPASPGLVYWCTVCPSLCALPLTSLPSLAVHRGSKCHRAAYREAFLEAGCRHLPDWETSHTSLPPTSCSHCSLDCCSRWLLLRHRRCAHPTQVPAAVREPYCHSCRLPLLTSWRKHNQEASHQLHHTDTMPCTFCPSRLESITPQAHYEQKHPEEMFRCMLGPCNSSSNLFLNVTELGRHQEQHHSADRSLHCTSSYLLPVSLLYTFCDQKHCFATFCSTDTAPLLMHMKETHRERNFSNILYYCRVCNSSHKKLVRAEEHAERHRGSNIFQDKDLKDILKTNTTEKKTLKKQSKTKCGNLAKPGKINEFAPKKYRIFCVRSSHHQSLLKLEEEFKDTSGFVESVRYFKDKVPGLVVRFTTPQVASFALKCVYNLKKKDSSLWFQWRPKT